MNPNRCRGRKEAIVTAYIAPPFPSFSPPLPLLSISHYATAGDRMGGANQSVAAEEEEEETGRTGESKEGISKVPSPSRSENCLYN